MSDADPRLDFPDDAGTIGKTSAESTVPSQSARERLMQGLGAGLTFYEYMLLVSLVIVTVATVNMYLNATEYGSFPFVFPWNTSEAVIGQ